MYMRGTSWVASFTCSVTAAPPHLQVPPSKRTHTGEMNMYAARTFTEEISTRWGQVLVATMAVGETGYIASDSRRVFMSSIWFDVETRVEESGGN